MFVEEFMTWCVNTGRGQRVEAIRALTTQYRENKIALEDRQAVEQVFLLIADDPAACVRKELAHGIADCDFAPRTLIWTLIQDTTEVSTLLYERSEVLTTAELKAAIGTGEPMLQAAIARRDDIDAELVRLIAGVGEPAAVSDLLSNEAVFLGPRIKHEIAVRLGSDATVRGLLLDDEAIDPKTRELLVAEAATALKSLVETRNWDAIGRVAKSAADARAKAAIEIFEQTGPDSALDYVEHLKRSGRLTTALLVRAACGGNAALFEAALAHLSDTTLHRVQSIIDNGRAAAFRALYAKSGLPQNAYPVFQAAMAVWASEGCEEDAVAEVILRVEDNPEVDGSLLVLLSRMVAETEKVSAEHYERQLLLAA